MTYERHIRLEGAYNVRDLGGYATAGGGTTRWRSFLRADALHALTQNDIQVLLGLGLRTVIDLRSDVEIERHPSTLACHPDIRYVHIPLFDGLGPVDAMLAETGEFDLSKRYIKAVAQCGPALAAVAAAIAKAEDGAVLFNCTAGKDRTGIVAAMLLSLAGVAGEEIAADYALTASLAGTLMERLKEIAVSRGLDEATSALLLSSNPEAMQDFLRHVEDQHGGFRTYLAGKAADASHIVSITRRMLAYQV